MITRLIDNMKSIIQLDEQEIALIGNYWQEKTLKKNDYLFRNGELCRYDSFVVSGALKAFYIHPKTGKEEILFFAIEDWWATDLESFTHKTPSIYNIQALEDAVLLQIHQQSFEEMLVKVPRLERYFRLILQGYISAMQKRVILTNAYDAEYRYWEFVKKYPKIIQKIPLYLIASYLGVTPEFLSRIRAKKN
jgi:CRP/FNR family transcriptional regulator, anaerobic regulatory protein